MLQNCLKQLEIFDFFQTLKKRFFISSLLEISFVKSVTFITPTVSVGTLREFELIKFELNFSKT